MERQFKIKQSEDGTFTIYKKRILFGWKMFTKETFQTVYEAIAYLSGNFESPTLDWDNITICMKK